LDFNVMDKMYLAGQRFDRILRTGSPQRTASPTTSP
jgi:hypothetical protein